MKFRWCDEAITLADNGRVFATTNSIHAPVSVVIVNNVEETPSASWHSLYPDQNG
jgi:hypothetical protein